MKVDVEGMEHEVFHGACTSKRRVASRDVIKRSEDRSNDLLV